MAQVADQVLVHDNDTVRVRPDIVVLMNYKTRRQKHCIPHSLGAAHGEKA